MSSHSSRIMLHNVSTADAGNYTCFSQNIVGNITTNPITVTIYSKSFNIHPVKLIIHAKLINLSMFNSCIVVVLITLSA